MKNKVVLILVILIVVILLGVILGIYLLNKDIKINETQNDLIENEKDDVGKVEENKEKISNEITILKVLDDIEKNSNFDRILKTTTGDISAEKLSKDEFVNSKEKYVTKLLNSMSLFNIYEENGNQYVEYETEKVLNALGYGTHMGNGIKLGVQKVQL